MKTTLLYSGGLDSLVSAGLLLEEDNAREVRCLFFDYGQGTADVEYRASQETLKDLMATGRLTLEYVKLVDYLPHVRGVSIVQGGNIPKADEDSRGYFVPGRNILFLLYSAIMSYRDGCREIAFSPHQWVHAGDCLPEFVTALTEAFQWGFSMERKKEPYRIWSPIGHLGKDGVVQEGTRMGLPLHLSWSCHDWKEKQCGVCHNCEERQRAFRLAQVPDVTEYLVPAP